MLSMSLVFSFFILPKPLRSETVTNTNDAGLLLKTFYESMWQSAAIQGIMLLGAGVCLFGIMIVMMVFQVQEDVGMKHVLLPTAIAMATVVFFDGLKIFKLISDESFSELSTNTLTVIGVIAGFLVSYVAMKLITLEANSVYTNKQAVVLAYSCFIAAVNGKLIRSRAQE